MGTWPCAALVSGQLGSPPAGPLPVFCLSVLITPSLRYETCQAFTLLFSWVLCVRPPQHVQSSGFYIRIPPARRLARESTEITCS
ncbi:hypothetical protein E2C01_063136 [Portunus trituberculatus]|uniref:Uncharacterized protein n=1 Tax=Portunus trituberculatus TaxID=210409 RepID=A0A5B7HG38_PORTR|nr:hypothetical protein [Portunus trituberculatus]